MNSLSLSARYHANCKFFSSEYLSVCVCSSHEGDVICDSIDYWCWFESVEIAAKEHKTVHSPRLKEFAPVSDAF